MKWSILSVMVMAAVLTGCSKGGEEPTPTPAEETTPAADAAPAVEEESEENLARTNLAALKIGDYDVQPFYAGELHQGHLNAIVNGPAIGAVRMWVGTEDAAGVMVVKAELEGAHYCGDMELPKPIPADARLWMEIETPAGERHKGSVPLNP